MDINKLPKNNIATDRLSINLISQSDSDFIFMLVNSPKWLEYIGDRNVKSGADAKRYVENIMGADNLCYWVVKLKENDQPIGIVTWLKRPHLELPDIGFAFLPEFEGFGYAYEAVSKILSLVCSEGCELLAISIPSNTRSIRLLEKLRFQFYRETEVDHVTLHVYRLISLREPS